MKWIFVLLFLFPRTEAQVPAADKRKCEYSNLTYGYFKQGSLRDDAAEVLSGTVRSLRTLGLSDDQICRSNIYVNARKLYERIATEQEAQAAAVKAKYLSKESSL